MQIPSLITPTCAVHPALLELMVGLGFDPRINTPTEVNTLLQKEWFKTGEGTVRAQIGGRLSNDAEIELLDTLGSIRAIPIDRIESFDKVVVLGATMKAMARRLSFLMGYMYLGLGIGAFPPMTFLVSQRKVILGKEGKPCLPGILNETGLELGYAWRLVGEHHWPKTEAEVASFLCNYAGLLATEDLKVNLVVSRQGANTTETVRDWFGGLSEVSGRVLVVSSQPFCGDQLLAIERIADDFGKTRFQFEVCGPTAPQDLPFATHLDALAKRLWGEVQILPK